MIMSDSQRKLLQTKGVVLGRVLIGLLFLFSGIGMATDPAGTAGFFSAVGVPMAGIAVWLAIVVKIGGGGLLIIGKKVGLAAVALILFTLAATVFGHLDFEDPMQVTQIFKNLSIIGGLIYVMAFGPGKLK